MGTISFEPFTVYPYKGGLRYATGVALGCVVSGVVVTQCYNGSTRRVAAIPLGVSVKVFMCCVTCALASALAMG